MIHSFQPEFPPVLRHPDAILSLRPPNIGVDFEWSIRTGEPTIIGVSDGETAVSVPFADGIGPFLALAKRYGRKLSFVGHGFIRAERPILARHGLTIPLEQIKDTIISHWLVNAHLCKAGGKAIGDGNELERRGPGFMNIWTMCSLHTSSPCWKFCREGDHCHGVPCPHHEPFWYNGLDAREPVNALPDLERKMKLLGVEKLYPMHAQLHQVFHRMQTEGVWVDTNHINGMREEFQAVKGKLWKKGQKGPTEESLPFNPNSGPQVRRFFEERYGLKLRDNTEETIRRAVNDNWTGAFGTDDDGTDGHCKIPELAALLTYKESGAGIDRWFAPRVWTGKDFEGYVVDHGNGLGTVHPNINNYTSTGRTACTGPNLQNLEKRRVDRTTGQTIGDRVRRAIIAPPGHNLYSADFGNGENRCMLWYAGYSIPFDKDLHAEMVSNIGLREEDEFSIIMGSARDAAKSVTHATDYMEGLQLLSDRQLRSTRVRQEIAAGARVVYSDWRFRGLTVTFTGVNLALRAFGSKDWGSRAKALDIMRRYIDVAYPKLREVQRRITREVESGMVKAPHGYALRLYDRTPEDIIKTAMAFFGSNPIAHYLKLSLLNIENHPHMVPAIPVHDEHVFYVDKRWDPTVVKKWITEAMVFETPEMPGFSMPIKLKVGPNWKDMVKVQ